MRHLMWSILNLKPLKGIEKIYKEKVYLQTCCGTPRPVNVMHAASSNFVSLSAMDEGEGVREPDKVVTGLLLNTTA